MDVSLEKYTRQGRANTRIPKETNQMTSYEELDVPRDNKRNQQEKLILNLRIAPITSQDTTSLSTTPVIQINITIPMIMTQETIQILHASSTIAI